MQEELELKIFNQLPSNANGQIEPAIIQCFTCEQIGETKIEYRYGMWTLLACVMMQCVCGPLGSVVLFMKDCKDIYHICRNCGQIVGIAEKSFKIQ